MDSSCRSIPLLSTRFLVHVHVQSWSLAWLSSCLYRVFLCCCSESTDGAVFAAVDCLASMYFFSCVVIASGVIQWLFCAFQLFRVVSLCTTRILRSVFRLAAAVLNAKWSKCREHYPIQNLPFASLCTFVSNCV